MSKLPDEVRRQLKILVSEASDESIDLLANLFGRRFNEKDETRLKREAELEIYLNIDEMATKFFQMAVELQKEVQLNKLENASIKERFYLATDIILRTIMPDIPKGIHAMDYLFKACEEISYSQFTFSFLKDTRYSEYLKSLRDLIKKLEEEGKIDKALNLLYEFKDTNDAYTLLQSTLQKIINYYKFLSQNYTTIKKEKLDKYLEIYSEMSGQFEKIIALVATLIEILRMDTDNKYKNSRKRRAYDNICYIKKNGYENLVLGFNRNIRNALAHKTYKIDIIKETVDFYDVDKKITLTFREAQKETRELAALLLILPHLVISIFCLKILSIREIVGSL
jgi:hypothetical protein